MKHTSASYPRHVQEKLIWPMSTIRTCQRPRLASGIGGSSQDSPQARERLSNISDSTSSITSQTRTDHHVEVRIPVHHLLLHHHRRGCRSGCGWSGTDRSPRMLSLFAIEAQKHSKSRYMRLLSVIARFVYFNQNASHIARMDISQTGHKEGLWQNLLPRWH